MSGEGATPDWLASSLRCLSQSCTIHNRHSCNLSFQWSIILSLLYLSSFSAQSDLSEIPSLRPETVLTEQGCQFHLLRAETSGQNKKTSSNGSYVHGHPSTEAFDRGARYPLQTITVEKKREKKTQKRKHDSSHTVVDCRGAASHARTIRRYTSPYLVEFYKLGSVHSIINEEPSIQ